MQLIKLMFTLFILKKTSNYIMSGYRFETKWNYYADAVQTKKIVIISTKKTIKMDYFNFNQWCTNNFINYWQKKTKTILNFTTKK